MICRLEGATQQCRVSWTEYKPSLAYVRTKAQPYCLPTTIRPLTSAILPTASPPPKTPLLSTWTTADRPTPSTKRRSLPVQPPSPPPPPAPAEMYVSKAEHDGRDADGGNSNIKSCASPINFAGRKKKQRAARSGSAQKSWWTFKKCGR
jgi:hypothetical protein